MTTATGGTLPTRLLRSALAATTTALLLVAGTADARQQAIGGVVIESGTQRPLVGAQVIIEGTDRGTLTDNRGRFLFADVGTAPVTLRVVIIGYRELTHTARPGETNLVLVLTESAVTLDQIIVTGTPQQQVRRALGNAVGTVDVGRVTAVAPPPNVQKLVSNVPGVALLSGGGDIGASANIRIRGANSLTLSSEPLLYIDGVRVSNTTRGGPGVDSRAPPARMNDLNPDDIQSIEIIKGPAAATLYGTEASNGVINIITKRGRTGAPVWNFTVKQGANWLPNPEKLFPPVYYRNAAGSIVEFHPLRSDRITGEYPGDTISYGPWFRTGRPQEYEASVSGGAGPLGYFYSTSFSRDEGPVTYNWRNRLSNRANFEYTPDARLSVNVGLSYVQSRYRSAGAVQPISVTILWACPSPGCEPGRNLPGGVDGPTRGYLTGTPERYEEDYEGYEDLGRGILNATVRHEPFRWFSHRLTVGGDFTRQRLSSLARRSTRVGANQIGSRTVDNYAENLATVDYAGILTTNVSPSLALQTAAGVQYYQKQTTQESATGSNFPVRALETVTAGALRSGTESFLENKTFGAFFQEQVAWKNRLFLTGAIRGDDNSAFGANYEFVVYPKFSASWVVTEEPFMDGIGLLNSLKLRTAWGRAGQQPDAFAALRIYAPSSGQNSTPTLTPSNIGNPDLRPEVGEEIEAGFDATLLDERLGVEFTLYRKRTKDAIVQVPVTPSLGFPGSQFQNLGEVRNRGFEFGIRAEPVRTARVQLNTGLSFSRNTNEVVDLGGPASIVISAPFGMYNVTGFPLGSIFMTRVVSADLQGTGAQARAVNMMCEGGERIPGTNFSRGGGAPVPCAGAPAVFWGASQPTWEGSLSAELTLFRNLRIYSQVDAVGGHTLLSGDIRASLMSFRNQRAILERTDPILLAYDVLDIRRQPGTIDAGFAKLRDVSMTYTLPRGMTERFGFSRASVTLSSLNLWTIWRAQLEDFGVRHVDTEIRNVTNELTAYYQEGWPQLRRFLTTIRVTQ
jgi:TonB-linked SusC/RagA family outer membrane protein